jgi:molecular chaperone GrpE (heat shock protein)
MRGLFVQAERAIEVRTSAERQVEAESTPESKPAAEPPSKAAGLSLPQLLRPVVQGLEALSRATNDNTALLKKLDTTATTNAAAANAPSLTVSSPVAPSRSDKPQDVAELPQIVAELRGMIEAKTGLNQSMFSALHQELKGYKDGFLLESVHRPIIRDLVSLYDDITGIQRQISATISDPDGKSETPLAVRMTERLRTIEMNLDHNLEFISEVLNRLEVTLMDPHGGKLDKRTQRAVSIEFAEDPDRDGDVVRVVKRGFLWKDRVLRAEEVVIKKWQEGFLVALQPQTPK